MRRPVNHRPLDVGKVSRKQKTYGCLVVVSEFLFCFRCRVVGAERATVGYRMQYLAQEGLSLHKRRMRPGWIHVLGRCESGSAWAKQLELEPTDAARTVCPAVVGLGVQSSRTRKR